MGGRNISALEGPERDIFERLARLNEAYLLAIRIQYRAQSTDMGRWNLTAEEVSGILERIERVLDGDSFDPETAARYLPAPAEPIVTAAPEEVVATLEEGIEAFRAEVRRCRRRLATEPFEFSEWYSAPQVAIVTRYPNEYVDVRQPLSDADALDGIDQYLPHAPGDHRSFSPAEITHGEL